MESENQKGVKPYEVIEIQGDNGIPIKIGIVGYLTTDTPVRLIKYTSDA